MPIRLKTLFSKFTKRKTVTSAESPHAPMQRWSQQELNSVKEYLEEKPVTDFGRDDHHLTVDYIVQRYLPTDDNKTEQEWQTARARLVSKVDKNIEIKQQGLAPVPEFERQNALNEERRRLLLSSYAMPLEDFADIILPCLSRYPFSQALSQLSPTDLSNLWQATTPYSSDETSTKRYQRNNAKDALIGKFDGVVLKTCAELRKNYEMLRRARSAGYERVRFLVEAKCTCFRDTLDGVEVRIADAISPFEQHNIQFPLLPPVEAACALLDSPCLCSISLIALEPPEVGEVIPPFLSLAKSRGYAASANFCFGVMPPSAMFGRS